MGDLNNFYRHSNISYGDPFGSRGWGQGMGAGAGGGERVKNLTRLILVHIGQVMA